MSFWEDFTKMFKKGVTVVAKKTDEYTKIGKIKVDIIGIKRDIDKQFTQLGGKVYQLIAEENDTKIASNEDVKEIVNKVKELSGNLADKKEELERVREEYGESDDDIQDVAAEEIEDEPKG
ncbi:hypothetical protein B6I21_07435 [candidate division KSB1 bacterium 4572_119]|nr:MAG: hypothetical protein B6I21_07435 [candidate division KSB1 bacterium 4572_119]